MADEEEYEIMPHKTIENIKREIENLKIKAASKDVISAESLRKSLDNLTVSINSLMSLFKEAAEEMKLEEKTEEELKGKLDPLLHRMYVIESENKKIAQGILALADMINKKLPEREAQPQPKVKETIRRTYTEELVPKIPKPEQQFKQQAPGPVKSFSTFEEHEIKPPQLQAPSQMPMFTSAQSGFNARQEVPRFGSERPFARQISSAFEVPPETVPQIRKPAMPPFYSPVTGQAQPKSALPSAPLPPLPEKEGGFIGKLGGIFKKK